MNEDMMHFDDGKFRLLGYWLDDTLPDGGVDRVFLCDGLLRQCLSRGGHLEDIVHGIKFSENIATKEGPEVIFNQAKAILRRQLQRAALEVVQDAD